MITGAKVKTDRRDAFKLAKLLRMIANCILAHKIAAATFHMLKEGVAFDEGKLFG